MNSCVGVDLLLETGENILAVLLILKLPENADIQFFAAFYYSDYYYFA